MNASTEHRSNKRKRGVRPQAFYPCPPPSVSELDRYSTTSSSSSSSDDEFEDYNSSRTGYINTLVRGGRQTVASISAARHVIL